MKLNVEFSPAQATALQQMAGQLNETQVGVLRLALSLMVLAVRERREGRALAVIRDGKVVKEIVGLWPEPEGTAAA